MPVGRKRFPACPVERTLAVLSGRWKAMIVWNLASHPKRYSELAQQISGVAERVLTQALRELREDGVLQRTGDYWHLTPLGDGIMAALRGMYIWGEEHAAALPDR